jgi:hypothetical protein
MSLSSALSRGLLEVDARGTHQLGDDDTLGAVDDEGALVGHQREVAHEDRLRLDLAGLVVEELRGDEQRLRVGQVLLRHCSSVYLGSSKRWSRNDSDICPLKSSIGLISSKISSRPQVFTGRQMRQSLTIAPKSAQRNTASTPPGIGGGAART